MTVITVVSVSTPAVRDSVIYSRNIRDRYGHPEVEFRIHYLCGSREDKKFDSARASTDIMECDFLALDLMGANDGIVDSISEALMKTKCQRVVISGFGPIKNRLGKYDEKRFRMDRADADNVALFSAYWRNAEGNDIESAFDMVLSKYFGMADLPDPEPISTGTGAFLKNPVSGKIYNDRESYFIENPRDPGNRVVRR